MVWTVSWTDNVVVSRFNLGLPTRLCACCGMWLDVIEPTGNQIQNCDLKLTRQRNLTDEIWKLRRFLCQIDVQKHDVDVWHVFFFPRCATIKKYHVRLRFIRSTRNEPIPSNGNNFKCTKVTNEFTMSIHNRFYYKPETNLCNPVLSSSLWIVIEMVWFRVMNLKLFFEIVK